MLLPRHIYIYIYAAWRLSGRNTWGHVFVTINSIKCAIYSHGLIFTERSWSSTESSEFINPVIKVLMFHYVKNHQEK